MHQKDKVFFYIVHIYWIIQVITLFFIKGFADITITITALFLLVFLILEFFIKSVNYKKSVALILFLYSLIFCITTLFFIMFFHPTVYIKYSIMSIGILNLIISATSLKILKQED
jgi:hypothetical protein